MEFTFLNCFLLIIPILIWNFIHSKKLCGYHKRNIFWKDIPKSIMIPESFFRIVIMLHPLFMPISYTNHWNLVGFLLYSIGVILYFFSWIPLMKNHESKFSKSFIGFNAPAYTPIIWLLGIAMIGNMEYGPVNIFYFASSIAFILFHSMHSILVFKRIIN